MTDENLPADAHEEAELEAPRMPTSQPVLLRALRLELIATVLLAVIFGVIGYLVSGTPGIIGGLLGVVISGIMACLTVGSIAFANHKFIADPNFVVIFFGIVAGGWLIKLVAFVVLLIALKYQTWLDPKIFFFGLVAGVIVSLAIDAFVVLKSRVPYVDAPGV